MNRVRGREDPDPLDRNNEPPAAGIEDGEGPLILVVERDGDTAGVLTQAAPARPWTIIHTASAADAQQALRERRPALIVLDLLLPDADGRDFVRELRAGENGQAVPVLALDASSGGKLRDGAMLAGAERVISTPVDDADLVAAVEAVLKAVQHRAPAVRTDPLTGLPNREGLKAEWEKGADGSASAAALVILTLDGFDELAASLGWGGAEAVLSLAGARLASLLSPDGVVGRWGGETFVAFLPAAEASELESRMRDVLDRFRDRPFRRADGEGFRLTFSAGVSPPPSDLRLESAMSTAARHLYRVRAAGGNRVYGGESARAEGGSRTILLAEDDPLTAELLRHRLEREGYQLRHFDDGLEAFEAALRAPVALAIFDVKMPGMDGFELLERLRRIPAWSAVPVVMLTSMGGESDVIRGFELGADEYVVKPFSPRELLARIRRFLT